MNTILEYVEWLTNVQHLPLDRSSLPSHLFGLMEELYEWLDSSDANDTKELGDILAYTVLVQACLGVPTAEIAQTLEHLEENDFERKTTYDQVLAQVASDAKRLFRGDTPAPTPSVFLSPWFQTQYHRQQVRKIGLLEIAAVNREKLTKRLESAKTFCGSGDR